MFFSCNPETQTSMKGIIQKIIIGNNPIRTRCQSITTPNIEIQGAYKMCRHIDPKLGNKEIIICNHFFIRENSFTELKLILRVDSGMSETQF